MKSELIYFFRSEPGFARRFLKRRVDRSDCYIGREADTSLAAVANGSPDSFPRLTSEHVDGRGEIVNWRAAFV